MKVIIIENLYPKLGIVNGTINYIQNISANKSQWIQGDHSMHPPTNVYVDLNEFIKKHDTLQDITLESLPKNVIPIVLISKTFQYHHQISKSNTTKTFNINRYQLSLALAFCFTNVTSQGQTFDHMIIDLKQPPNNVPINMHNIYVTLS
jgi:hypothetical protein